MNRLLYAQRNARAIKNLEVAISRLRYRFALPDGLSDAPFVPSGATADVRRLLETEHLVTVLDAMASAPVNDDANLDGMPPVETGPVPSRMEPTPRPEVVEPSRVTMGFPDNPGMPVLHGPGSANVDATGVVHGGHPFAERHAVGLAHAAAEAAAEAEHVQHTPGYDQDAIDAARIDLANAQAAALAHDKMDAGEDLPEGKPAGFPENPGPPALTTTTNVAPVDQDAVEAEREKMAEAPHEAAAERERERREAMAYTTEGEVFDDPADAVDIPAVEGTPENAGQHVDTPAKTGRESASNDPVASFRQEAEHVGETNTQRNRSRAQAQPAPSLDALPLAPIQKRNLARAGFNSAQKIRDAADDDLLAVSGVGPATVEHLRAILANGQGEAETAEKG